MKTFAYLGLAGFALAASSTLLVPSIAEPTHWTRVSHAALFKTVHETGVSPMITASPDVVIATRGVDALPERGVRCCEQIADAVAY